MKVGLRKGERILGGYVFVYFMLLFDKVCGLCLVRDCFMGKV